MRCIRTCVAAAALVLLGSHTEIASADETKTTGVLPGVDAKAAKDVVGIDPMKTDAAPEPVAEPGAGWVKVGDWDVKVSGSVTYDISTAPLSPHSR